MSQEAKSKTAGAGAPRPEPREVADAVHSAAIHLLRAMKGRDKVMGLSPAKLSALSVLYFAGPLTLGRLAEAEQVKPPTVSRLVKDLEREQLVARSPAENDSRSVVVEMTEKGKTLFERARINRLMALETALENLTGENLQTLLKAASLLENAAKTVREH